MKTIIKAKAFKKKTFLYEIVFKLKYLLGNLARKNHYLKILLSNPIGYHLDHNKFVRNRLKGVLTEDEVNELVAFQEEKVTKDCLKRDKLTLTPDDLKHPENLSTYQKSVLLCRDLLNKDPSIKTLANIGARVDVIFSFLAQHFPEKTFYSVDFQRNLVEHNQYLVQSPNWHFKSGYAIDLFKQGFKADVILVSSTMVLFRYGELCEYFRLMSENAKYIVINDSWWLMKKPEELPKNEPIVSGIHHAYHYNYPAILARYGFEVVSSEIVDAPNMLVLQLIAKNMNANLSDTTVKPEERVGSCS